MHKRPREIYIINDYMGINDAVFYIDKTDKKVESFLDFDLWYELNQTERYKSRVISIKEFEDIFGSCIEDTIENEIIDINDIECFVEFVDLNDYNHKVYVAVYNY